jgi:hypothetical protein
MIARRKRRRAAATLLLSASMLVGLGCGDDTSPVNVDTGGGSTGTGGSGDEITTVPVTSADSTMSASASGDTSGGMVDDTTMGVVDDTSTSGVDTGSDSESDSGDSGTTGDEPLPGQTQSQLVSSGRTMSSESFTMVYTLGQPTQTQATHSSTNYRLQGGLVGANGSPP